MFNNILTKFTKLKYNQIYTNDTNIYGKKTRIFVFLLYHLIFFYYSFFLFFFIKVKKFFIIELVLFYSLFFH